MDLILNQKPVQTAHHDLNVHQHRHSSQQTCYSILHLLEFSDLSQGQGCKGQVTVVKLEVTIAWVSVLRSLGERKWPAAGPAKEVKG